MINNLMLTEFINNAKEYQENQEEVEIEVLFLLELEDSDENFYLDPNQDLTQQLNNQSEAYVNYRPLELRLYVNRDVMDSIQYTDYESLKELIPYLSNLGFKVNAKVTFEEE